jgi:hypothetical protein
MLTPSHFHLPKERNLTKETTATRIMLRIAEPKYAASPRGIVLRVSKSKDPRPSRRRVPVVFPAAAGFAVFMVAAAVVVVTGAPNF